MYLEYDSFPNDFGQFRRFFLDANGHTDGHTDEHTDIRTDGQTDGQTNRWTLFYRVAKLLVRPCFGLYFREIAIIHRQGFKKLVKM